MNLKNSGIETRTRIILGFSALLILFLGVTIYTEIFGIPGTSDKGKFGRYRDEAFSDMELASGLLTERFTALFRENRLDTEELATFPHLVAVIETKAKKPADEVHRELKSFLDTYSSFRAAAVIDAADGSVLGASGAFAQAQNIRDLNISQALFARMTIPGYEETIDLYRSTDNQDYLRIARQIKLRSKEGTIAAIIVTENSIENNLRQTVLSAGNLVPRQWNILLAGKSGNRLITLLGKHTGTSPRQKPDANVESFAPIRLAISGINGPYDGPDENGRPVLAYHRQIRIDRGIALALVLKMDRSLALKPAWSDLYRQFVLWACMLIAGIGLCVLLARRISEPIQELAKVANRIEQGDLTARASVTNQTDVGKLAEIVNGMVERLTTWHSDLEKQVSERTRDLQILSSRQDALLTAIPDIIVEMNNRGIYTWSNQAGREFFGTEVVGQAAAQYFIRNQETSESSPPISGGITYVESWHRRKDGEARLLAWRQKALDSSESGETSFLLTARDVTERKQAEEALLQVTERFNVALQSSKTGAWDWNIISGHIEWSSQMFDLFGLDAARDKASFEVWLKVLHPDDVDVAAHLIDEALKQRNILDSEYRIILPDGSMRWINAVGQGKYNPDGQPLRMIGICQDITGRKRADEERRLLTERLQRAEKMEALGTLAGGVAHDLNNILGIVVGYAEMLSEDIGDASPLKNTVTTIMEAGHRSAAIVQDLLTLARRGVQTHKIINLNTVITDCVKTPEFEAALASNPGVLVKTHLPADLMNIAGSPVHLTKTILNLIRNAIEAMSAGGELTIATSNQSLDAPVHGYDAVNPGDYAVLSVADTGDGISESDIQHIFEPFYTKKTMGRSGTGLGLAVVWGTVKDHDGYIDVQSKLGKGTVFNLYFPVSREEIEHRQTAVPVSDYIGKDESILVVDDIKEQRELAATMLGKLNYKVRTAASGEEAVEYLKSSKADLIILDMIMEPGMDGLDTYKTIIGIHPKQKAIIVSGFSETHRVKEAQALGAGEYLRKPYVMEKLGLAVRKELDK